MPVVSPKEPQVSGTGNRAIRGGGCAPFPDSVVARMDLDTTHGKESYEQIINDFQQQKIQILVGTQMLSKGLDFDHVSVVGIISADSLLNYPDFVLTNGVFN